MSKDPKVAEELIRRQDINKTLAAAKKEQTATDANHTKELHSKLGK